MRWFVIKSIAYLCFFYEMFFVCCLDTPQLPMWSIITAIVCGLYLLQFGIANDLFSFDDEDDYED